MGETPRTDELVTWLKGQLSAEACSDHPYYVLDQMAAEMKRLERELAEAREAADMEKARAEVFDSCQLERDMGNGRCGICRLCYREHAEAAEKRAAESERDAAHVRQANENYRKENAIAVAAKEAADKRAAELSAQQSQEPVGYIDAEQLRRWDSLRGTEYESPERCYMPFSRTPFKSEMSDCSLAVYTAPSAPATSSTVVHKGPHDMVAAVTDDLMQHSAPAADTVVVPVEMPDQFSDWLESQMPPGTRIASAKWWAPKIYRAMLRAAKEEGK